MRRSFSITEIADARQGLFVIYVDQFHDRRSFFAVLAYQVCCLLNDRVRDAYMAGLCSVFAERFLNRCGMAGASVIARLGHTRDRALWETYLMMKDVSEAAGPAAMKSFLGYARDDPDNPPNQFIDIDGWIECLPAARRLAVVRAVGEHAAGVRDAINSFDYSESTLRNDPNFHFSFRLPRDITRKATPRRDQDHDV